MSTKIEIDSNITVGILADKLMIPVTELITELMKNGIIATVNERIDFETAQIITEELKLDVELSKAASKDQAAPKRAEKKISKDATARPPVVAVMGHVDHGKTSLLDAIRGSQVADKESGGITQHISAYQIVQKERPITFLDTPGHEAFAAIREHGARLTDLVVIVIAADDGIKPQTLEAIRFARKANVKMIVAINKIDKEGANPDRIKQQLAEQSMMPEEWGGDTVVVNVSAKTNKGVSDLLDMILLVADVEELKADVKVPASGLVIEAHMEQGRGPVAVALVESGELKKGDFVVAGATYARVRNLEDTLGKPLVKAGPSTPVVITGFKSLPQFGDEFVQAKSEKEARSQAVENTDTASNKMDINSSQLIKLINRSNELSQLNVIVKADVQGSLTSVLDSLKSLDTSEVAVKVVGSAVGPVNDNDVHLAQTTDSIIYAFNVAAPPGINQIAIRDKVTIRSYKVIYELLDDAKEELSNLLAPEIKETAQGRLVIKGIFKTTKTEVICGGEVTKGKLVAPSLARVLRDGDQLAEVKVTNLKRGPQDTKEVQKGEMCGMNIETESKLDLQEGDHIEVYTQEIIERTL